MSYRLIDLKAIADILNDDEFWNEIANEKKLAASSISRRLVNEGAVAAESVGVVVNFDMVHPEAIRIAQTTSSRFWAAMTDTERTGLNQAITAWQETGLGKRGLPDLIDSLEPLFGRSRAKRIAATESTRLFGEGNRLAAQQDEVVGGLEWQTTGDAKVCPICAPKDGLIYPKDGMIDHPAHVNCRCALIPVSWNYIQKHPSKWQGGPIPEGEMEELVPEPRVEEPMEPGSQTREKMLTEYEAMDEELAKIDREIAEIEREEYTPAFREMSRAREATGRAMWQERLQEPLERIDKLQIQRLALEKKMMEGSRKYLQLKTKIPFNAQLPENLAGMGKDLDNAKDFVSSVYGGKSIKGRRLMVHKIPTTERAYYQGRAISISRMSSDRTMVHEMGHWVEDMDVKVSKKCRAFLEKRTKGEKAVKMVSLIKGYDPLEMTKKDIFIDPYMGKQYLHATEILSMGMEYLYADPVYLAVHDPEYFDFIVNTLRGL